MSTAYFSRQRHYKCRRGEAPPSSEKKKANEEAEDMIHYIKETRGIFRKLPNDSRLEKRVRDINEWMKENMRLKYKKVVLPVISNAAVDEELNRLTVKEVADGVNSENIMNHLFGHGEVSLEEQSEDAMGRSLDWYDSSEDNDSNDG